MTNSFEVSSENEQTIYFFKFIIAHRNTLLFVSHCGMTGILEAIYHRVPIVGIANFANQVDNVVRIQDKGIGVAISKHKLSDENVYDAIQEVLRNERYVFDTSNLKANYESYKSILQNRYSICISHHQKVTYHQKLFSKGQDLEIMKQHPTKRTTRQF